MSERCQFLREKQLVDQLLMSHGSVQHVEENLNGTFITFKDSGMKNDQNIRLATADGRKYLTNQLIAKKRLSMQ
ncbi:MAG: hypothetical protein ABF969_10075 [Sporolactobacillus sp.]